MKVLKILLIGIFVLTLLIVGGAFLFIKTFDINKYRPQIAAEISKQLGRSVEIDKLGLNLSLANGVYAQVNGLKIGEDTQFAIGNFLSIDSIQVTVDALGYLSRKEIVVNKIAVRGLDVTVIRNSQGQMNVQKIGPASKESSTDLPQANTSAAISPALPNFLIQSIVLENGKINFVDQSMNPPFSVVIEKVAADCRVDSKDLEVKSFSAYLSTGLISGNAKITDYLNAMNLTAKVRVNSLPVGAVVTNLPEGMKLGGDANLELNLSAHGLSNPDVFISSLNSTGSFNVKDGKIENFNIFKMVLSRIELIPGLVESIQASIPEKYQADFMRDETVFDQIGSSIQINGGTVNIPDLVVVTRLFAANLQITADPKLNGRVSGQLKIPSDLSESLVSASEVLQYLRASDGQITISLTSFEGPLANMKILPDVKELGKVAIQNEGKRQIGKLLDKVLSDGQESPEGSSSAGQEIIGGVLDKIFK